MPLVKGHHKHESEFTQIPNPWLRDKRLSLQSIGLLAQIMSHREGWSITLTNLALANNIGRDAIRTAVDELLKFGYLSRSDRRERNSQGQLASYVYVTKDPELDKPTLDLPTLENPTLDEPTLDKPQHKKNIDKKNIVIEENNLKGFADFWNEYPKKADKGIARRAYVNALKKVSHDEILQGAKDYALLMASTEKRFIKNPATWLNAEAWGNQTEERKGTVWDTF